MTETIERIPFGKTNHESSRAIFGAAALGAMNQERADRTIDLAVSWGLNHFDVAASYGDAELRLAPWLKHNRDSIFWPRKPRTAPIKKPRIKFTPLWIACGSSVSI